MTTKQLINLLIILLVIYVVSLGLKIHNDQKDQEEAQRFIQACYDAGGVPVYDLCAEKSFRVIKLPGYDWDPEVDEYNKL